MDKRQAKLYDLRINAIRIMDENNRGATYWDTDDNHLLTELGLTEAASDLEALQVKLEFKLERLKIVRQNILNCLGGKHENL